MSDKIEIRATGETITFIRSDDCDGIFVETIGTLPASGKGPPAHRHIKQTEMFEAIEGRLGLDCGGKRMVLVPGQSFTVPVNTVHRCYSADGKEIRFKATFTPALSTEYLFRELFDACNRNNSKNPSAFDACYILQQAKGEYGHGSIPQFAQQLVFPIIIGIGKMFGLIKAKSNLAH